MARWVLSRVATGLITLLGIAIVVFLSVRLVPGQAERVLLGPLASEEDRAALVSTLGLDRDLFTQFGLWFMKVLQGDLGTSIISQEPVVDELALRLPVTASLAVLALVMALAVGIPLGIWQAVRAHRRGGAVVSRVVSGLAISVPEFVLGALVVLVFSMFPVGITVGAVTPVTENFLAGIGSLLLPAAVLSVFCAAATARTTRDATLGVLVEPYIQAAKARGDSPGTIIRRHVLRNVSIPILTLAATLLAQLLGGAVIVEGLFNVPGVGSYMLRAMDRRDFAVVQAVVMFAAIVFVVASMLVELASSRIDLRVATTGDRT